MKSGNSCQLGGCTSKEQTTASDAQRWLRLNRLVFEFSLLVWSSVVPLNDRWTLEFVSR